MNRIMMAELKPKQVYRGQGVFILHDQEVGEISEIDLVYRDLPYDGVEGKSYYGTICGRIRDRETARSRGLSIKASVKEVGGDSEMEVFITEVEFIDPVPKSCDLKDHEFHGE